MLRERALQIVLVLVGLLFSAAILPVVGGLRDPAHSDTGDTMMMGLYCALGIFLLIAARNPSAHRSLIAFAAWSSFAHAIVMSVQGFEIANHLNVQRRSSGQNRRDFEKNSEDRGPTHGRNRRAVS